MYIVQTGTDGERRHWKRRGVLKPVIIPGSSRALGYRESDVDALIAGDCEKAEA